jgi:hypothetical protein
VPVSVGRTIIATWEPHEATVLQAIRDLGLEAQVIFNKGAVMVLPAGVNKATGLAAALDELELSPHNAVGVGDAENDHAFLGLCECAVAVANALPLLRQAADFTTPGDHGRGVEELIEELLGSDLAGRDPALARHHILLGRRADGREVRIPPYDGNVLVAGPSGSGKSTTTTGLLERLAAAGYQFCVVDPEGDYQNLEVAVTLGSPQTPPVAEQVLQVLRRPADSVVVNLLGIPLADRPLFFAGLLPRLQEMRAQTGRPHWLVLDEAHHLLPGIWDPAPLALPQQLVNALLITVHPDAVSPRVLTDVRTAVAVGDSPADTLARFARAVGEAPPQAPETEAGQVVAWLRGKGEAPFALHPEVGRTERRRHSRKYAEGELPPDRSFYFRGPEGKLNLRSRNLILFLEMAEGVGDDTWLHHLRRGDYSRWFREAIKDPNLARAAEEVEADRGLSAAESRARIRQAVERHYTLAATAPTSGERGP